MKGVGEDALRRKAPDAMSAATASSASRVNATETVTGTVSAPTVVMIAVSEHRLNSLEKRILADLEML